MCCRDSILNKVPVNVKGWDRAAPLQPNVQSACRQSELSMDAMRLMERQEVVRVVLIYLEINYAGASFLITSFFLFQFLSVV
jgi:hypothetical protein